MTKEIKDELTFTFGQDRGWWVKLWHKNRNIAFVIGDSLDEAKANAKEIGRRWNAFEESKLKQQPLAGEFTKEIREFADLAEEDAEYKGLSFAEWAYCLSVKAHQACDRLDSAEANLNCYKRLAAQYLTETEAKGYWQCLENKQKEIDDLKQQRDDLLKAIASALKDSAERFRSLAKAKA